MPTLNRHLFLLALGAISCAEQTPDGADPGDLGSGPPDVTTDLGLKSDGAACANPSWKKMSPPSGGRLVDLWGISETTLFALGGDTKIHRFEGPGWHEETVTWQHPQQYRCLGSIWGNDLNSLYAVGRRYVAGPMVDVGVMPDAGIPPHTSGTNHAVMLRRDATGWKEVLVPDMSALGVIWGADPKNIFMVGRTSAAAGAKPQFVRFDGTSWETWPMDQGTTINAIWGTGPNNVYAVGNAGAIYHFDGTDWAPMHNLITKDLLAVWGTGPKNIWAVGDGIFRFDGKTWATHLASATTKFIGVWGTGPNNIYAMGQRRYIQQYDGKMWGPDNLNHTDQYAAVWGNDRHTAYIAGTTMYWLSCY